MVDTTVKVYYFPVQGACQGIRYTLAAGGIAFEDVTAKAFPPTQEDKDLWVSLGKNTTTNVPMIVVGDKAYTQSTAVIRQAARLGNLMPTGDDDLYLSDKLIADASDLNSAAMKGIKMFGATPEAEKKFVNEDLPKHVGNIERQLGDNEWFVGGKLSVADIAVYDALTSKCRSLVPDCLGAFPKLDAFVKRVEALPNIAKYRSEERFTKLMAFPAIKLE